MVINKIYMHTLIPRSSFRLREGGAGVGELLPCRDQLEGKVRTKYTARERRPCSGGIFVGHIFDGTMYPLTHIVFLVSRVAFVLVEKQREPVVSPRRLLTIIPP